MDLSTLLGCGICNAAGAVSTDDLSRDGGFGGGGFGFDLGGGGVFFGGGGAGFRLFVTAGGGTLGFGGGGFNMLVLPGAFSDWKVLPLSSGFVGSSASKLLSVFDGRLGGGGGGGSLGGAGALSTVSADDVSLDGEVLDGDSVEGDFLAASWLTMASPSSSESPVGERDGDFRRE
jgi:hypothetical protein